MGFISDLKEGQEFEQDVSRWINDVMGIEAKKNPDKKGVDIVSEQVSVEVKFDRMMRKTGNVFLEFECNGIQSGIFKDDEAELLVYGDYDSALIFRLSELREEFARLVSKFRVVNGGDGWRAKGLVIPISEAKKISKGEIFVKREQDNGDLRKEEIPQEP